MIWKSLWNYLYALHYVCFISFILGIMGIQDCSLGRRTKLHSEGFGVVDAMVQRRDVEKNDWPPPDYGEFNRILL